MAMRKLALMVRSALPERAPKRNAAAASLHVEQGGVGHRLIGRGIKLRLVKEGVTAAASYDKVCGASIFLDLKLTIRVEIDDIKR
jgi:hypothetical protein